MRKNENKRTSLFSNVINVFEQHSRDFSRRSDILDNSNAGGTVAFKSQLEKYLTKKFY